MKCFSVLDAAVDPGHHDRGAVIQQGHRSLHGQCGAADVGREGGVDVGGAELGEGLEPPDAGVDVDRVQTGAAGGDGLERGADLGRVGGARVYDGDRLAEFGCDRVELGLAPAGEDDVSALGDGRTTRQSWPSRVCTASGCRKRACRQPVSGRSSGEFLQPLPATALFDRWLVGFVHRIGW